jgi:hypothetical protein
MTSRDMSVRKVAAREVREGIELAGVPGGEGPACRKDDRSGEFGAEAHPRQDDLAVERLDKHWVEKEILIWYRLAAHSQIDSLN